MTQVKALDLSASAGDVSAEGAREAYDDGVRLVIVQAWGGLPDGSMGPNPHCRQQLATFRELGCLTGIYVWVPPDTTTDTRILIEVAKAAAGDEYPHVVLAAPDIEDPHHRRLHPTSPEGRLQDAIFRLLPKPVPIYTSRGMWPELMRRSTAFGERPLWDASWGLGDQLDVNFHSYGGWNRRAALQYQNTITRYGIVCDLDVADLERLGVAQAQPIPEHLYANGLSLFTKRVASIVDAYPLTQTDNDDPDRERAAVAAWQELYDREVLPRLDWMQRG